ncbi:class I SAM-dependent methyltransferase [Parahaliea mediterranea]|uniref:Class I SAM-dependent methyltransferase n=1 Tax=Parahaliea mediterranea TaxID=651086 RepID=A0A939IKS1_9GAMM|nr:class I SAM-dependent methyltransferase [Parahaliea mediterranea]MBN7795242.1 class I SAM-dependent methyltransferase [Parahaliea mediterranea]
MDIATAATTANAGTSSCALCGGTGKLRYGVLTDRLFGASGSWRISQCTNPSCKLLWLDPTPEAGETAKAYNNYYTHANSHSAEPASVPKRLYRSLKEHYLATRFGYTQLSTSASLGYLSRLLHLFPRRRSEIDEEVRHLHAVSGGRLLDVGCGSGKWLVEMQQLGWETRGIDFDSDAVEVAKAAGLRIDQGSLETQHYPQDHFDAITLNHVIEHLPDPLRTLSECHRILKPGGVLMLYTPNSESMGHRVFKQSWRGLEPPRHLYLFSQRAMQAALATAGFCNPDIKTTNSLYMWQQSIWLENGNCGPNHTLSSSQKMRALLFTAIEQAALPLRPLIGECLVVQAEKT